MRDTTSTFKTCSSYPAALDFQTGLEWIVRVYNRLGSLLARH